MLKADKTTTLGGVVVKEFLLTKHNPNRIAMPTARLTEVIGVTMHNTDDLPGVYEDAEQYTRATYNGNMKSVRVHYYVDDVNAWQNLPLDLSGWHAADGSGDGNRKTIAIECIMTGKNADADRQAEDNAAKLAAALLHMHGLGVENLYTHTHWLNVKDGKTGSVDKLNTLHNSYKNCPLYILPHWEAFKSKVAGYLEGMGGELYRVRKTWDDEASQIGAFGVLANAQAACKPGYTVYNSKGVPVLTNDPGASEEVYRVKVTADQLNIRSGPSTEHKAVGVISDRGVYTITQTVDGWGKLKSGAGWIRLKHTERL